MAEASEKTPQPDPAQSEKEMRRLPLVPLRDDVVFPKLIVPLSVGRRSSIAAITSAMDHGKQVLLVAQKDPQVDDTTESDLYATGTIADELEIPLGTVMSRLARARERLRSLLQSGSAEVISLADRKANT